jgi:hypothetical protein
VGATLLPPNEVSLNVTKIVKKKYENFGEVILSVECREIRWLPSEICIYLYLMALPRKPLKLGM